MVHAGGLHTKQGPSATVSSSARLRLHLHPRPRGGKFAVLSPRRRPQESFTTRFRKAPPTFGNALRIGPAPADMSAARAQGCCYPTPIYGLIDARSPKVHGVSPSKRPPKCRRVGPVDLRGRLASLPRARRTSRIVSTRIQHRTEKGGRRRLRSWPTERAQTRFLRHRRRRHGPPSLRHDRYSPAFPLRE